MSEGFFTDLEVAAFLEQKDAEREAEAQGLVKMYQDELAHVRAQHLHEADALKAQNAELVAALKEAGRQPIHVHMAEGMVTNTTHVAPPHVDVHVAPPELTIAEGAIKAQIVNQPSSTDLEIVHPGGQKTTLRRRQ